MATSSKNCLLVLDMYCGHLTDSMKAVLSQAGMDIAIIPGGRTDQPQPLDVSINKHFENVLPAEILRDLAES
ncbi:hypothetical protein HPB49_018678 [Dermacentor silvarum]|uniref:Uncharacterized protein n=1 Tax=Dermacentor silvarum TaxID=543639 RepID=A0ACB8DQY6_DERSI|nr:hypothetical protein HPB49_018678 [Dermacentor silvarum]